MNTWKLNIWLLMRPLMAANWRRLHASLKRCTNTKKCKIFKHSWTSYENWPLLKLAFTSQLLPAVTSDDRFNRFKTFQNERIDSHDSPMHCSCRAMRKLFFKKSRVQTCFMCKSRGPNCLIVYSNSACKLQRFLTNEWTALEIDWSDDTKNFVLGSGR